MEENKTKPTEPEKKAPEHHPDKHEKFRAYDQDNDDDCCCARHCRIKKCVWALLFFLAGYAFSQMWNCCCCQEHYAKYNNLMEHSAQMKALSYPNDIGGGIIIINTEGAPNVDHFTGRYHPNMAKKSARGHQPNQNLDTMSDHTQPAAGANNE